MKGSRWESQTMTQQTYKILIADDEPELLELAVDVFEASGFQVTQAPDGLAAQKLLSQQTFDLVLSDVYMPGLSGIDLFKYAASELKESPYFFFMSGEDAVETESVFGDQGCFQLFVKPFDFQDLVQSALGVLKKKRPNS